MFRSITSDDDNLADSIAKVEITFEVNTAILPNSTIVITMGGLKRDAMLLQAPRDRGVCKAPDSECHPRHRAGGHKCRRTAQQPPSRRSSGPETALHGVWGPSGALQAMQTGNS